MEFVGQRVYMVSVIGRNQQSEAVQGDSQEGRPLPESVRVPLLTRLRRIFADQLRYVLAIACLMEEATGQDALVANLHAAAASLVTAGLLTYKFGPEEPPWSFDLQCDLDDGLTRGLLWQYASARDSLLPRHRLALTHGGKAVAREVLASVGEEAKAAIERAVGQAVSSKR